MNSTKAPKGCKTPKRDRYEYRLNSTDLDFMVSHAEMIWNMLCYYSNMPENRTGTIYIEGDRVSAKFDRLCELIEDIKNDLWSMEQR